MPDIERGQKTLHWLTDPEWFLQRIGKGVEKGMTDSTCGIILAAGGAG